MERISTNELEHRVDEVLFYIWDPIGVDGAPEARTEYRSYVCQLLALLQKDVNETVIADHLQRIAKEIGIRCCRTHSLNVAAILRHHKAAIDDGLA